MKSITFFLIAFICLFAQCQKDDVDYYPDLSVGGVNALVDGKGLWVLSYQDIDSISKDSVVYVNHDWPMKVGGLDKFHLLKLDKSNRRYLQITRFPDTTFVDTLIISLKDDLVTLHVYYSIFPYSKRGVFIGRYDSANLQIIGYLRHKVGYTYIIPPMPWRYSRTGIATVMAECN